MPSRSFFCEGVTVFQLPFSQTPRPAMKTFITALVVIFALASGISMAALTGHDHTHFAQNGAHAAGNQQTALLY